MIKKRLKKNLLREGLFFVILYMLLILYDYHDITTLDGLAKGSVYFLIIYLQAQLHRFFLVPILFKKQYKRYVLFSTLFFIIGTVVLYFADYYWIYADLYQDSYNSEESFTGIYGKSTLGILLSHVIFNIVGICIIMSPFLMWDYYSQQQRKNLDKIVINDIQIKLLHTQLNPHFFFNVLNNLYGISLHEPNKIPPLLIQLSKLMRYQIESSSMPSVSLSKEIEFIQSYITLERERVGNRCLMSVKLPKTDTSIYDRYSIAPLILMPLIENTFKHGLAIINECYVEITLQIKDDELTLCTINSLPGSKAENSTGIGLSNTRKRLELLYKDFELQTGVNSHDQFRAFLRIKLSSYLK